MRNFFFLFLLASLVAGCATGPSSTPATGEGAARDSLLGGRDADAQLFSQHYWDSDFQITGNAVFGVEMMHQYETLTTDTQYLHVMVHNRQDQDIPGAGVYMTGFMPEDQDATRFERKLHHDGSGLYTLTDPPIPRPGHWRLAVTVKHRFKEDRAVFDFHRVQAAEATVGPEVQKPEPQMLTRDGKFLVTPVSPQGEVPYKREHKWIFELRTAQGDPVDYGLVSMNAQHLETGKRTAPAQMDRLGRGLYSLSPVVFDHSGTWEVYLLLLSQDANDNLDFQIEVNQ